MAISPLPYGSVLPRERLVLEIAAFAALAVLLLARRENCAALHASGAARPVLALVAIGVLGLLQALPWPPFLAEWLLPRGAESWQALSELGAGDAGGWIPLSIAPAVSRSVALVWLAVAAAVAAAAMCSPERRSRRFLGLCLGVVTIFEIAYGTRRWFEASPEIWGRTQVGAAGRLRGTFVNPDHFALFLIIAMAVVFAWAWWSMRRSLTSHVALERRLLYVILPWLLFVMLFVALAFTGSRAGFVGGLVALAAQALFLTLAERSWGAGLLGLLALGLGLASLLFFGWQRGLQRWLDTSAYEIAWNTRFEVYADSLELWLAAPWTGTGLGTFRQAFPWVQPPDLELTWFHAHSDVLELLVTTGVAGMVIALWGLGALARRLWHVLEHGRRSEDRGAALAALGALAGALTHSAIDFGLTLPANSFVLAVVLGLACGVRTHEAEAHGAAVSDSASSRS